MKNIKRPEEQDPEKKPLKSSTHPDKTELEEYEDKLEQQIFDDDDFIGNSRDDEE